MALENNIITYERIPPQGCCSKTKHALSLITVEPIMFLYYVPYVMLILVNSNLFLEKSCRVNLKLNESICDGLTERNSSMYSKEDEENVQKLVTSMNIWRNIIQSLLPIIFLSCMGSWSDKHKHLKPSLIFPVVGGIVKVVGLMISVGLFYQFNMAETGAIEVIPSSLLGSTSTITMGVNTYVTAISSVDTRTVRLGFVGFTNFVSYTLGIIIGGILWKPIGYQGVYSIALTMYTLNILYTLFRVKEINSETERENASVLDNLKDFLNFRHMLETITSTFRSRERNYRLRLVVMLILVGLVTGPQQGKMNVVYLFTRIRFQWSEVEFSLYYTYHLILNVLGLVIILIVFSNWLNVDDSILGIIGCSSKVIASIISAFAPNTLVFYLGKVFSVLCIFEAVPILIYGPLYNVVYNFTIDSFPGTFFLVGGGLTIPAVVMFLRVPSQETDSDSIMSNLSDKKEPPAPAGCLAKTKNVVSQITVEPILVLFFLPFVMLLLVNANLLLEKGCRVNLKLNDSICDGLTSRNESMYNKTDEEAVQKLVTSMNIWRNVIQSVFPVIFLSFMGSWSDHHNLIKPSLIIPVIGGLIKTIGLILTVVFYYQINMEVTGAMEVLPNALSGGGATVSMGVNNYISTVSSVETRTVRLGFTGFANFVSFTLGIVSGGILLKQIGYYGIYVIAFVLYLLNLLYSTFYIKEVKIDASTTTLTFWAYAKDFFNVKHIMRTLRTTFRKREKNYRLRIIMMMILLIVVQGPQMGEVNVVYLFTRIQFQWSEVEFSIFYTYHLILNVIGLLVVMLVFSKWLKIDDALLGVIGCASKVLAAPILAFAPKAYVFYLAILIEMYATISGVALRAIITKIIPNNELGKILSVLSMCEALPVIIYGPLYNMVYSATINTLPGAFYLVGGALTLPAVFIFLWLYMQHRKDRKEQQLEIDESEAFPVTN